MAFPKEVSLKGGHHENEIHSENLEEGNREGGTDVGGLDFRKTTHLKPIYNPSFSSIFETEPTKADLVSDGRSCFVLH